MFNESNKIKISSWNEWDALKHVIVGRTDIGGMEPKPEPGMIVQPMIGASLDEWGPFPEDQVERGTKEIEAFVKILEKRGIRVDRPTGIDPTQTVQTPDWEHEGLYSIMPPRDMLMPVGNEIIEATMSQRSRWFEFITLRPLLEQYFKEDPDFLWTAAPKPRLTDESFDMDYWDNYYNVWSEKEKLEATKLGKFKWTEKEPMFDAADAMRCGKDIFVQISSATNLSGIDWLRRHLATRGLRVHEVSFNTMQPWHIDTTTFTPREGLLFQNGAWMPHQEEFHELFRMNDWEIVMCAPAGRDESHELAGCSCYLGYNVFSLDPKTICVETAEKPLMDQLDSYGFDIVPVDFNEVSPFGGGLHCATVDIFREGDCEDYFPKQIPGY